METITVSPGEQRVLLLFDGETDGGEREKVEEYLKAHDLTPRREYTEERDGTEYLVYYFGQCYLEPHLEAVAAIAERSS